MNFLSRSRAQRNVKLLPEFVQKSIEEECVTWKTQIFSNLKKSIETDNVADIEFWISKLEIFVRADTYWLEHDEIEELIKILLNYITKNDHWKTISNACSVLNCIYKPRYMEFNLTIEWRPLFEIIKKLVFSRSKLKRQKQNLTPFPCIAAVIQNFNKYFSKESTQEMLDEFLPILDPHHNSFVIAHYILCLFLPAHEETYKLWFDKFISMWPMYRSVPWDFQWLRLFSRLARQNFDIDWKPHLPMIFNCLSSYIGIPLTLLEVSLAPVNDYPHELYPIFFLECSATSSLFSYFVDLILSILGTPAKDECRKYIEKVLYMLQPYCSPAVQIDDAPDSNIPIAFINCFMHGYLKRTRQEKKGIKSKVPYFKKEDHEWFVHAFMPLVVMERFTYQPSINQLKDFAELLPSEVIHSLLDTVIKSVEIEKLEVPAIKTLAAILPIMVYDEGVMPAIHDLLLRFANNISFMKLQMSVRTFAMFVIFARCTGPQEEISDIYLTLVDKCIQFLEHIPPSDMRQASVTMRSMISTMTRNVQPETIKEALNKVNNAVERLPLKALRDIIEAFSKDAVPVFLDKAIHAKTERDFSILLGLSRHPHIFLVENVDTIIQSLIEGIKNEDKKIRSAAISCARHIISSLLITIPNLVRKSGYIHIDEATVDWHVPSEDEMKAAEKIVDSILGLAKEFIKDEDTNKHVTAVDIVIALAKGMAGSISNSQFSVIKNKDSHVSPPMKRFIADNMKHCWLDIIDFVSQLIKNDTEDRVLTSILKVVPIIASPHDKLGACSSSYLAELQHVSDMTSISSMPEMVTADLALMKGLKFYSFRQSVEPAYFTEEIKMLIEKTISVSTINNSKIQERCAYVVQTVASIFQKTFGKFFIPLIEKVNDPKITPSELAGASSTLCYCCQLTFNETNFQIICDIAKAFCKILPTPTNEESIRTLRQFILLTFDIIELNEIRFPIQKFIEIRKKTINDIISQAPLYKGDHDVELFAVALVISMSTATPVIIDYKIFEFLLQYLEAFDNIQIFELITNNFPILVEHLIPRIDVRPRVKVSKITKENYDQALFSDKPIKSATHEARFLSKEERSNVEVVSKYFPDDAEERVKIHKLMEKTFAGNIDTLLNICKVLVNAQIHQEESYCKGRVHFWASLIRFFGMEFSIELHSVMDKLTEKNAITAQHFIAAEILSSVMFSIKGFPFKEIEKVIPLILQFITKVILDGENEFQSIWFISVVFGISDRDPNRYFWFFPHLLNSLPSSITQIRDIKTASLIVDILLEFVWKMNDSLDEIIEKGILPMFEAKAQGFEQIRECAIRAVSSIFGCCFKIDGTDKAKISGYFDKIFEKANHSFIIPWFTAQFTTQTMSSFVINTLTNTYIEKLIDLCIGKKEDEEKKARVCLLHFVRSNWLWACSEKPLTLESTNAIIQSIIKQLSPENKVWQAQTVLLLLIESFIGTNYFFISDEMLISILKEIVLPMLENNNYDVQDSAAEMLTFLLKSNMKLNKLIDELCTTFRRMVFGQSAKSKKLGAVKGLIAILQSALLFDSVPQYIHDVFQTLIDARAIDSSLTATIDQALNDFWAIHEANLTADVVDELTPYRDSTRPSYFC